MKIPGKIAVWVFCLVFLAVIILQAGDYSYSKDNGFDSFEPSGTSAFLELVKRVGFKPKVVKTSASSLDGTIIVPVSYENRSSFIELLKSQKTKSTIIAYMIPRQDRSKSEPVEIRDSEHKTIGKVGPISINSTTWQPHLLNDGESTDLLTLAGEETAFVRVYTKGDVRVIEIIDAACITNRNLDKANNASVMMGLISQVAETNKPISFITSFTSKDNRESIITKLGAPVQAAWGQLLILIFVIFVTLSVRFGLAPESRAKQRGARELVDGLAWMTRRKRNARWALRAVFDRVLTELERRHRIGREHIIQRPDLYLPPDQARILKDVEAATLDDISEQEAIRFSKELKKLV